MKLFHVTVSTPKRWHASAGQHIQDRAAWYVAAADLDDAIDRIVATDPHLADWFRGPDAEGNRIAVRAIPGDVMPGGL
jgi:hypothetical protein